jgi:hypothetical protein
MMKSLALGLLLSSLIACLPGVKGKNGVVYKSAVQYNNYIVERQNKIIQQVMQFARVSDTNLDSASALLDLVLNDVSVFIEDISGMPAYKKDTALRNSAVALFTFYADIFKNDYKQIIAIRQKDEFMTEEDLRQINEIVHNLSRREEQYDKRFQLAQKNFAKKNNMTLGENKMQKRLEEMNRK